MSGTSSYLAYNVANELCWKSTSAGSTCASTPAGATIWSFDGNGNVSATATPTSSLSYDGQNQTTGITANGVTFSSLGYADVDESERTSMTQGSTTTQFLSSQMGLDSGTTSSGSTYTIRDPSGTLVGYVDTAGNDWYYLSDGQGSVVAVISATGATVGNRYAYDDWGQSVYSFPGSSVTQPYGYAGGYTDATGLVQFGLRYYDPALGRWTQEDSVNSANLYLYASNDPINQSDPSGAWPWTGAIRAILAALASATLSFYAYQILVILFTPWMVLFSMAGPAGAAINIAILAFIGFGVGFVAGCTFGAFMKVGKRNQQFWELLHGCLYDGSLAGLGGAVFNYLLARG